MRLVAACIVGYLLGSVSFSIIIGKLFFGKDPRDGGSGNAGATNMARLFGILPGIATVLLDALKAAASLYVGTRLGGDWGMCIAGIGCMAGHCFPVYYGFRGGKGVSAGVAVAFFVAWQAGVAAVLVFAAVAAITRKASAASVSGAIATIAAVIIFPVSLPGRVLMIFSALLLIVQHRSNIKRLINGTEADFKAADRNKNT